METWETLLKKLLKSVRDTKLSIHNHWMSVTNSHPYGFHKLSVPACRHGAQVVLVIINILRR